MDNALALSYPGGFASEGNVMFTPDILYINLSRLEFPTGANRSIDISDQVKSETRFLSSLKIDGENIPLASPVKIELCFKDGFWFADNDKFEIFSSGDTRSSAIREFSEVLFDFYETYKEDDPEFLAEDAKNIREKILVLFADNEL